jgi:hypothetical protein
MMLPFICSYRNKNDTFVSAAGSSGSDKGITGFNMQEVSLFYLEQALKLGGEKRVC